MSRLGFHWQAIELRDKSLARPAAARSASEPFARGDSAAPRGGGIIQRPNYLSKIKRFALGE